ncbi:hypothetical protein NMY22_g19502 [Coprinellus aureogranulatus]|nr:hypothetical protein NMY22_g19502 [Coprinellus aureogranulatus]
MADKLARRYLSILYETAAASWAKKDSPLGVNESEKRREKLETTIFEIWEKRPDLGYHAMKILMPASPACRELRRSDPCSTAPPLAASAPIARAFATLGQNPQLRRRLRYSRLRRPPTAPLTTVIWKPLDHRIEHLGKAQKKVKAGKKAVPSAPSALLKVFYDSQSHGQDDSEQAGDKGKGREREGEPGQTTPEAEDEREVQEQPTEGK